MFCDAHRHTAFNNTDKTRIILQIDVIRPEYACIENWISARVLASILTQKISIWILPFIRGRWYLYVCSTPKASQNIAALRMLPSSIR